jgi:hypothetical protein
LRIARESHAQEAIGGAHRGRPDCALRGPAGDPLAPFPSKRVLDLRGDRRLCWALHHEIGSSRSPCVERLRWSRRTSGRRHARVSGASAHAWRAPSPILPAHGARARRRTASRGPSWRGFPGRIGDSGGPAQGFCSPRSAWSASRRRALHSRRRSGPPG